jgi:MFS family permease
MLLDISDRCGLSQQSSNLGIQWHVIAMYAAGFFTGRLIARFGAKRVVMAGLAFTAFSAATGLLGIDVAHFWLTRMLLGMGWNFGFVGASALVLECHQPEEKARVQSLNDFIVFGTMAFSLVPIGRPAGHLRMEHGARAVVRAINPGSYRAAWRDGGK